MTKGFVKGFVGLIVLALLPVVTTACGKAAAKNGNTAEGSCQPVEVTAGETITCKLTEKGFTEECTVFVDATPVRFSYDAQEDSISLSTPRSGNIMVSYQCGADDPVILGKNIRVLPKPGYDGGPENEVGGGTLPTDPEDTEDEPSAEFPTVTSVKPTFKIFQVAFSAQGAGDSNGFAAVKLSYQVQTTMKIESAYLSGPFNRLPNDATCGTLNGRTILTNQYGVSFTDPNAPAYQQVSGLLNGTVCNNNNDDKSDDCERTSTADMKKVMIAGSYQALSGLAGEGLLCRINLPIVNGQIEAPDHLWTKALSTKRKYCITVKPEGGNEITHCDIAPAEDQPTYEIENLIFSQEKPEIEMTLIYHNVLETPTVSEETDRCEMDAPTIDLHGTGSTNIKCPLTDSLKLKLEMKGTHGLVTQRFAVGKSPMFVKMKHGKLRDENNKITFSNANYLGWWKEVHRTDGFMNFYGRISQLWSFGAVSESGGLEKGFGMANRPWFRALHVEASGGRYQNDGTVKVNWDDEHNVHFQRGKNDGLPSGMAWEADGSLLVTVKLPRSYWFNHYEFRVFDQDNQYVHEGPGVGVISYDFPFEEYFNKVSLNGMKAQECSYHTDVKYRDCWIDMSPAHPMNVTDSQVWQIFDKMNWNARYEGRHVTALWDCSGGEEFVSDAKEGDIKHWHFGGPTTNNSNSCTIRVKRYDGKSLGTFSESSECRGSYIAMDWNPQCKVDTNGVDDGY